MTYLTPQEIFTAAWNQAVFKLRCVDPIGGACRYRSGSNRCFIGAVIPDDKYDSKFEGRLGFLVLVELGLVSPSPDDAQIFELVSELQRIHDSANVCDWSEELTDLATKYKLVAINP